MSNIVLNEKLKIKNMIYEVRGKQVMMDRDLARLYDVETRLLIQKVKRNIQRFPEEFSFKWAMKNLIIGDHNLWCPIMIELV